MLENQRLLAVDNGEWAIEGYIDPKVRSLHRNTTFWTNREGRVCVLRNDESFANYFALWDPSISSSIKDPGYSSLELNKIITAQSVIGQVIIHPWFLSRYKHFRWFKEGVQSVTCILWTLRRALLLIPARYLLPMNNRTKSKILFASNFCPRSKHLTWTATKPLLWYPEWR